MADETYYSLLGIGERATPSEIKAAYRALIKQVHPDTVGNLSPYLRSLAEDKARKFTEAYSVLSDTSKRGQYDALLASYRQSSNAPPPPKAQTAASPVYPPPPPVPSRAYRWGQTGRVWTKRHPIAAVALPIAFLLIVVILASTPSPTADPSAKTAGSLPAQAELPSPDLAAQALEMAKASSPAKSKIFQTGPLVADKEFQGVYSGTVHNISFNTSSAMTVTFVVGKTGVLTGCTTIDPPLQGSGHLHGHKKGVQVDFGGQDIEFHGSLSGTQLSGKYVVSYPNSPQQFGEFSLEKREGSLGTTQCEKSAGKAPDIFDKVASQSPLGRTSAISSSAKIAVVISRYASVEKRCAFLPEDNYGRCNYGPETVAALKIGDNLKVLSTKTRAENGKDILRVRTEQGWVGWVDSDFVQIRDE